MNTRTKNSPFRTWLFSFCFSCLSLLLFMPVTVMAGEPAVIEIMGNGVGNPLELTLTDLEELEQYQHVYSTINTWPNKRWYTGKGVRLRDLFALAEIKEEARVFVFTSEDGYSVTLTVKELLQDRRYYFPGLKDNHPHDGSIPGSPEGAVEVEPILALYSAEGSDNPHHMTGRDALQLLFGQRAIIEQTNNLFLKYVSKIEVQATAPERWDQPRANIPDGTLVPEGTMLILSNKFSNEDKIYYTTDGSMPTVESAVFNWSASRWWSLRDDLASVNSPIEINRDTVIKAITIGPGREDSEVITFTYQVDYSGKAEDPTKLSGGPPTGVTMDRSVIELKIGSTFQLEATVAPYNAANQNVSWSSSDTSVATVDTRGLVTVVGPGTATITVRTADGNHMAAAVINGPKGEKSEQGVVPEAAQPVEKALLPDEDKQYIVENDEVDLETATRPASHEILDSSEDEAVDERPLPEENRHYLADKKDMAAASTGDTFSEQQEFTPQQMQVYEMSIDNALHLSLPDEYHNLDFYPAVAFLLLFLIGVRKRYTEYVKEV
jgi:hypothetical protein